MKSTLTRGIMLAAASALTLSMAACGSDDSDDTASDSGSSSSSSSSSSSAAPTTEATSDAPFGAACSQVPTSGEGSVEGMTDDPVATAASNNPLLATLVQAVTAADLVDTLNSAEEITVFAPAEPAFEALPAGAFDALAADVPQLTTVLTHHVIEGRIAPEDLAGTFPTLNGDEITIAGSGEEFTIDGTVTGTQASVICGNVQTANATVYVIDQVLAPATA